MAGYSVRPTGANPRNSADTLRIVGLYNHLTRAFTHPFDWMALLEKPPFWRISYRQPHLKVKAIFQAHGFELTPHVAREYHRSDPNDWQHYGEDAGGKITRKLKRALASQLAQQRRG
jgi:hypothetical protein